MRLRGAARVLHVATTLPDTHEKGQESCHTSYGPLNISLSSIFL